MKMQRKLSTHQSIILTGIKMQKSIYLYIYAYFDRYTIPGKCYGKYVTPCSWSQVMSLSDVYNN